MNRYKLLLSEKLTQKITRDRIYRFIQKFSTESESVLDLGSGSRPYKELFPKAIAADIVNSPEVTVLADGQNLPFKDETFKLVVCTEMLEHLERPWQAVSEMHRVLKNGGKVVLTTRFIFPIHNSPNDYFRFTKFGLRSLFHNWRIILLKEETQSLDSIAILFQRLGFQSVTKPKYIRYLFFVVAHIISGLSPIISDSYGDINRSTKMNPIITSGYYLVCGKN